MYPHQQDLSWSQWSGRGIATLHQYPEWGVQSAERQDLHWCGICRRFTLPLRVDIRDLSEEQLQARLKDLQQRGVVLGGGEPV